MRPFLVRMLTASTVEREEMVSVKNNSVWTRKKPLTVSLASDLSGVTVHLLPVVEHLRWTASEWFKTRRRLAETETKRNTYGLRERLTTSSSSEISVETEGLGNRQVSLESVHGSTRPLLSGEDVTSSDVKTRLSVDVSID